MARRAKQDAEKTRTRILASALALFAKKGYEHTTFTDIAARLKMTKGAVYWHFESKQALLLALVDEMLAKFHRQISELLPPGETSFEGLSFPVVADMMVRNALRILEDPKGTAFFLLIHEQIKWADASMTDVRNDLMRNPRLTPCRRDRCEKERVSCQWKKITSTVNARYLPLFLSLFSPRCVKRICTIRRDLKVSLRAQ